MSLGPVTILKGKGREEECEREREGEGQEGERERKTDVLFFFAPQMFVVAKAGPH